MVGAHHARVGDVAGLTIDTIVSGEIRDQEQTSLFSKKYRHSRGRQYDKKHNRLHKRRGV